MAVVPRKRKGRVVYGVLTSWRGGKHWELVGPVKREAEQVNRARLAEVKAGTFRPGELTDSASVKAFAQKWIAGRTNRSRDTDEFLMRHVLAVESFAGLRMADVRPRHVLELLKALKASGKLAPKSIALVMGNLRVMFRDAVIGDVISATPYVVPRELLTRAGKKRTPYEAAEARALMGDAVGERERIWNAIAFYTGARCGEVCGLRWGDWSEDSRPLGALRIERQYGDQVLKTERARVTPVHPELAALLAAWRARWSLHYLHRPGPEDLIVPAVGGEQAMTKSSAYKAWLRSCRAAEVTNRSVHSTRHTFITLAQRGGADHRVVELITHNPKGTVIDIYTTRAWGELCAAVLCLSFDAPVDADANGAGIWAPALGLEPAGHAEKSGESGKSAAAGALSVQPKSADPDDFEAPVDARRTVELPAIEALALAAEVALRGRVLISAQSLPGRVHRKKGARSA